jgi:hypothetical protein
MRCYDERLISATVLGVYFQMKGVGNLLYEEESTLSSDWRPL